MNPLILLLILVLQAFLQIIGPILIIWIGVMPLILATYYLWRKK